MKHAREDYNRIQDPAGIIPEDEPVFLIRGQDRLAAGTVAFWANNAEAMGASKKIVEAARKQARAMQEWQPKKMPDM